LVDVNDRCHFGEVARGLMCAECASWLAAAG
jgi:hypothetical protein